MLTMLGHARNSLPSESRTGRMGPSDWGGTCQAVEIRVGRRADPSQEPGVRSPPLMGCEGCAAFCVQACQSDAKRRRPA